jgi:tetratricopeptide (TPR) repeat protein
MNLGEIWADKRAFCWALLLSSLVFLPVLGLGGQAELASIRGKVLDMEGNPIADASVIIEDQDVGVSVTVETNDKGNFYRRNLRPSQYLLTIKAEGFQDVEVPLQFKAGEAKKEEFRMVPSMSGAEKAFQRGIEAFNQNDFAAAAAAFEEVTQLSPETPEGHTNLALAYIQLKKMDEAIQELEKAAELSADFRTWAQLAMAYVQVDRLQAATRSFETALEKEHDPNDPIAYECWMALGSLYFADGRVPDSVAAYESALAINPNSAEAMMGLGKCHFNLQEFDKSEEIFRRVVDTAPNSPEAEEAKVFLAELAKRKQPQP